MITIVSLKNTIESLNYKWFEDKPNIIAIRTKLQVPDTFNDVLTISYKTKDVEQLYTAIITTEPGTTYQKKPLNVKGCWVMMPAQMIDAYAPGFHQNKKEHRCLQSVGKIFGLREDDKDAVIFNDKDAVASWQEGNQIGANIHGAFHNEEKKIDETKYVGPWSAGCQVHARWSKKEEMMDIVRLIYPHLKRVTYTLINESQLK